MSNKKCAAFIETGLQERRVKLAAFGDEVRGRPCRCSADDGWSASGATRAGPETGESERSDGGGREGLKEERREEAAGAGGATQSLSLLESQEIAH